MLDHVRGFFDTDRLSLSQKWLSHIRDYLSFISRRLPSTRDQDKLRDIRDKIKKDMWPDSRFETNEKSAEFLSDDEIEQACRCASDRGELIIRFLFDTGLRIGELRGLERQHIEFDVDGVAAAVRVRQKKTPSGTIEPVKSDAGNRTVELTRKTADMLRDYLNGRDLEPEDDVFPMSAVTYQRDVKAAFTEADVWINDGPEADQYRVAPGKSFVTPHWLRHNRNTRLKKRCRPDQVQQYMGQEDSEMTDHYTQFDPDETQGLVG